MRTCLLILLLALQDRSASDLIEKLRSDDVTTRDQAALALRKLGKAAFPVLEQAMEDKDKEVAGRARELLRSMKAEDAMDTVLGTLKGAEVASIGIKTSSATLIGGVPNRDTGEITILMKKGNRLYFNARVLRTNAHLRVTLISDGTNVWSKWPDKPWEEHETPADLNSKLAEIVVRSACCHPMNVGYLALESARNKSFVLPLKISSLELSSFDKDKPGVVFVLESVGGSWDVAQGMDPKTSRLLNAKTAARNTKALSTAQAQFEQWDLNREIPDERFAPPAIGKTEEDRIDLARKTLRTLRDKLEAYIDDTGDYPTTAQGLDALLAKPTKEPIPKTWKGPYLEAGASLLDPWGNPYAYRFPGRRRPNDFELGCLGPDGKADTDDDLR
jgi:general secretion pathway protein G